MSRVQPRPQMVAWEGAARHDDAFYALNRPVNYFFHSQKMRKLLSILRRECLLPLGDRRILDVGCGFGQQLIELENWGVPRSNLAGIDRAALRLEVCRRRLASDGQSGSCGGADIRLGDACQLPWTDHSFDIVHQGTLFTSLLDSGVRIQVAKEMLRVLKPEGVILWYDFFWNNPRNPRVRAVGAGEIRKLFPGCSVRLHRVTLAPPIARLVVPVSWIAAVILEKATLLNTHYLAVIRRNGPAR